MMESNLTTCSGKGGGTLSGPSAGDLGDWRGEWAAMPMPSAILALKVDWWASWLAQPVCRPPCWQNITPGVTPKDETISIVEEMPDVVITYESENGLTWEYQSTLEGGDIRFSKSESNAFAVYQGGTKR